MAVAEIFLTAFIKVLFEKLASGDLIRFAQSAGIYSDLIKWNDKLAQIQAVLVDAAQKHLLQNSVQLWLNKLQHLSYDIDDILDDLTTEAAQRQMNKQSSSASTSKVLKFIPNKVHDFKYGRKMSSKLDEITSQLHALVKEKNLLGLIDNVQTSKKESKRTEETSLVDVSKIVGREEDKEALLEKLLGNEESFSQNFSVVSIVGLGGIGKTTLAQVLYNDMKVTHLFELKSWVCVSDEFDVFSISKAIFQAVGGGNQEFANLNLLQVALSEKLSKKRFLLVLDDVWNEDYNEWELLQRPFSVGAPGSKVLVTTRKTRVATAVDSAHAYPLDVLSNEEALSLLAQNALGKQNFDSHPAFKLHGEGIVNKCGRLPLALRTLGRVLRSKTNDEEWEELLNSEIWNIVNEGNILPALRLSYYDLPPHLKQMFAYCSLFPKDYVFEMNELVLLWMAEGFLHGSYGNISMEKFGHHCFRELESRSFFQHSTTHKSQFTMHDLISDLAMDVAGEFFFMLGDKMDVDNGKEFLEKFHHFSFIRQNSRLYKTFKALQKARRLRTFLAMSVTNADWQRFHISNKVLVEVLPHLSFLRVLSLAKYNIREVPESIGGLKHLRYLNFSDTKITCLPEQVGDLYNLQSLLLSGCGELSSLPNSLVKLINLRHLDITDTPDLKELPLGIGGLSGLQTLSKVIVAGTNGFKLSHLKGLQHLEGRLTIEGLHKVTNATHAKEANLQKKKGLCDLEMKWSDIVDDSRNELTEHEVLKELRPFEKLTSLKVSNYKGTKFPSWVGDQSYNCLTQITLRGCRSCTCLPTLGHLLSLQKLFVGGMNGLKRVGSELLGTGNGNAFPSLEVLKFEDMEGWEEWSTVNGGGKDGTVDASFPNLHEISIRDCPKLGVLTIDQLIPSLRVLQVERCSVVVLRSMIGVSSSIVSLTVENVKGLTRLDGEELLEHLRAVEYLSISWCDELKYLWESEAEACKNLVKLQELKVSGCKNLVRLGEKKVDLAKVSMKSLRRVSFTYCVSLESYDCGSDSIEKLEIWSCGSMKSLTFLPVMDDDELPSCTLKSLSIGPCNNVEVNWVVSNLLSSLTSLCLYSIQNVRLLPEGCLVHLTDLIIDGCENIERIPEKGYGFLPHLCLRSLWIRDCNNIKSFPQEQLQSLTSLESMEITNCPNMDSSFPGGLWSPNLRYLRIGGIKKGMSEWGNFPNSLVILELYGSNNNNSGGEVVEFANAEDTSTSSSSCSLLLPSSLTFLRIENLKELERVSKGMEHLTSLETLVIWGCPKLRDLPETLLPSLSSLYVDSPSPELRKKCNSNNGKYWPTISQIPYLYFR